MTDKFISPCSQPELLEAMAIKAHNKERDLEGHIGKKEFDWDHLSEDGKQDARECMAAALEALKDPPEEFLEAMVVRVYRKINMCSEKETMQAALIAAINQTLKEGE